MKLTLHKQMSRTERASVLVIVMWILFGLISITLYFANSMNFELRASDNRVAALEAEQAIEGARRYISLVLSNNPDLGSIPDTQTYQASSLNIGNATVWFLGRTNVDTAPAGILTFGLIDEASKLNLNVATSNILIYLPRMTPDLANNIISWRTTNDNTGGAEMDTYARLQPPYTCKNASFETVDELRLVYLMDMETLYGEDANLNGLLEPNENDGEVTPPKDDQNGKLDPGLLEYCTVYTREPSTTTNGATRANLTTQAGLQSLQTNLVSLFGQSRAQAIFQRALFLQGGQVTPNPLITSPLQFYIASGMTQDEFTQIETSIRGASIQGLVNVNTASSTVLASLPGMDPNTASQLVSYRQANQGNAQNRNSVAWVSSVITDTSILTQVAPWLTGRTYQFTADIVAVGHSGRGFRRTRFVFDVSQGTPKIIYRQDLSHLGWPLGKEIRDKMLAKPS